MFPGFFVAKYVTEGSACLKNRLFILALSIEAL